MKISFAILAAIFFIIALVLFIITNNISYGPLSISVLSYGFYAVLDRIDEISSHYGCR